MRFKLVEQVLSSSDIPQEYLDEWSTADNKRREIIVREIIQRMEDSTQYREKALKLITGLRRSCYRFGIQPEKNPFIGFVQQMVDALNINDKHDEYLCVLVDMYQSGAVAADRLKRAASGTAREDVDGAYLLDDSLYHRNLEDFQYTVQIFETVLTPTRAKKFFKEPKNVSTDELRLESNGQIKPAGNSSTFDDSDTIYGVVEMWSDMDEDSTNSTTKQKKYTQAELNRIKQRKRYHTIDKIPKEEWKEGNVVYIDFLNHNSSYVNLEDYVDTWMQYTNGKWSKYDG